MVQRIEGVGLDTGRIDSTVCADSGRSRRHAVIQRASHAASADRRCGRARRTDSGLESAEFEIPRLMRQ